MPSREKDSVFELLGWPTPDAIESSSDPKRVCGDVFSAINLVDGDAVLVAAAVLADLRRGQPGVGADVGLADAVRVVEAADRGDDRAVLLQRASSARGTRSPRPAFVICQ